MWNALSLWHRLDILKSNWSPESVDPFDDQVTLQKKWNTEIKEVNPLLAAEGIRPLEKTITALPLMGLKIESLMDEAEGRVFMAKLLPREWEGPFPAFPISDVPSIVRFAEEVKRGVIEIRNSTENGNPFRGKVRIQKTVSKDGVVEDHLRFLEFSDV